MLRNNAKPNLLMVVFFAIAMAYVESAVVIYIREIYYPEGFDFPLRVIDTHIAITELGRELATIVMLISIGLLAGKNRIERFSIFLFAFAVWDIFYYVFLKILIDWPGSLMTMDILFFIPLTWIGPVLAPLLNSLVMIILAVALLKFSQFKTKAGLNMFEWILLMTGVAIILYVYMEDYTNFMLQYLPVKDLILTVNSDKILEYASKYIPAGFNWPLFITGTGFHLLAIIHYILRLKKLTIN